MLERKIVPPRRLILSLMPLKVNELKNELNTMQWTAAANSNTLVAVTEHDKRNL